ncbi:MAG: tyrosine transporter [Chlamydiae bacterium]|nr:tyrosine transporter [Chlamydiota bacterium]
MKTPVAKIVSGSFLVAGTAIGAGMLALPVATAQGGFFPALVIYIVCWLFMMATGLLLLEICLWMPKDANLVSMSYHLLGTKGKMISWVLYLFLFYCLTIAYVAGGGGFVSSLSEGYLSPKQGIFVFTLLFAPLVYIGTKAVDKANMVLMIGLCLSYLGFVILGFKKVDVSFLSHSNWPAAVLAMPIVFTSFSYQGIVPSLTSYLQRNVKAVRLSIILGTLIPLIIYILWEMLILGIVPLNGEQGLLIAQSKGQNAVFSLKSFVGSPWIYGIGQAFAFFALTTSFLGVTLGLIDFLSDGLKVAKEGFKKMALCVAVFLPPIVISASRPGIFLYALTYAGGIGCALLLGLIPIIMVWVGRYKKGFGVGHAQIPGGKNTLWVLGFFVIFELLVECLAEING